MLLSVIDWDASIDGVPAKSALLIQGEEAENLKIFYMKFQS